MTSGQQPDWRALAGSTDRSVAISIRGEPQDGDGAHIVLPNPADGDAGLDYRGASAGQVDAAVAAARAGDGGALWTRLPAAARREALLALAGLLEKNAAAIGLHDCLDIGKPVSAAVMEVHIAASMCRYFGELADKLYCGRVAPTDPGSGAVAVRRPRGVVAAIVPWNYPIINAVLKLAPALAAGNAVLLKPSELSPGSAQWLVRLCAEAGIPAGTVALLPGDGGTGAALARHAGVDMLTFTGSTSTGKALLGAAGDNALKPLLLECGGKSPELVFADARDLGADAIAAAIVGGCMANQGQLCVARSRLYIEAAFYDELTAAIATILGAIRPAHPLDSATTFGPLAGAVQAGRIRDLVDSGVADGATALVDGRNVPGPNGGGCYVAPTLFADVPAGSRIDNEEIFGPVLCVAPFSTEDDAVALANAGNYGLAATVWTCDLARSHRLGDCIRTGSLHVRSTAEQRFGAGWGREAEPAGQSGFGVEGGPEGVYSYTRLQAIQVDY